MVACDVPSGVNASTGEVEGEAVRAQATATFHAPKLGLYVAPGKEHAGRVETVEIGIPRGPGPGAAAGLIAERVLDLYPRRERSSSKFSAGVVVVVGGSAGLTGAPTMAARAASRAGAGYVQVAVPGPAQPALDMRLLEQMSRGLPDAKALTPRRESPRSRRWPSVQEPWCSVRASGAPSRRSSSPAPWRRSMKAPLLLDADGLNAHAERLDLLRERSAPTVLDPPRGRARPPARAPIG